MLGSLGFPEIAFILILALLVFGPRRLPEVGRKVGRALGEFRRATGDLKRSIDREMMVIEDPLPAQTKTVPKADADQPQDAQTGEEAVESKPAAEPETE